MRNESRDSIPACPSCGGGRLRWRLQRQSATRDFNRPRFLWTCLDCSHAWVETIDFNEPATAEVDPEAG